MCNCSHVILHPPAKFCSNRTNIGGLLKSYRFFKMAVMVGALKMQDQKMQDLKMKDQMSGHENVGPDLL